VLALLLYTEVECYFLAVNRRLNYYIFLFPIHQEHMQPVLRLLGRTFVHFWAILTDVLRGFSHIQITRRSLPNTFLAIYCSLLEGCINLPTI